MRVVSKRVNAINGHALVSWCSWNLQGNNLIPIVANNNSHLGDSLKGIGGLYLTWFSILSSFKEIHLLTSHQKHYHHILNSNATKSWNANYFTIREMREDDREHGHLCWWWLLKKKGHISGCYHLGGGRGERVICWLFNLVIIKVMMIVSSNHLLLMISIYSNHLMLMKFILYCYYNSLMTIFPWSPKLFLNHYNDYFENNHLYLLW